MQRQCDQLQELFVSSWLQSPSEQVTTHCARATPTPWSHFTSFRPSFLPLSPPPSLPSWFFPPKLLQCCCCTATTALHHGGRGRRRDGRGDGALAVGEAGRDAGTAPTEATAVCPPASSLNPRVLYVQPSPVVFVGQVGKDALLVSVCPRVSIMCRPNVGIMRPHVKPHLVRIRGP